MNILAQYYKENKEEFQKKKTRERCEDLSEEEKNK